MTVGGAKRERPRAFAEDWKTEGTPRPPTTIANPLGGVDLSLQPLTPDEVAGARGVVREGGIDLSPDGHEVAFAWEREGATEIYTAPLEGDRIIQLTRADARSVAPRWSRDGHWVAFTRGGALWVVDRDGENEHAVVAGDPPVGLSPEGTPQWEEDTASPLLDRAGIAHVGLASWSPDRSAIAYTTRVDGRTKIAFADVRDGAVARTEVLGTGMPFDDEGPVWRADGRGVAYLRHEHGNVALRRIFTISHADDGIIDTPGWVFSPRLAPDSETAVAILVDRLGADVVVRPKGAIQIQRLTRQSPA